VPQNEDMLGPNLNVLVVCGASGTGKTATTRLVSWLAHSDPRCAGTPLDSQSGRRSFPDAHDHGDHDKAEGDGCEESYQAGSGAHRSSIEKLWVITDSGNALNCGPSDVPCQESHPPLLGSTVGVRRTIESAGVGLQHRRAIPFRL